ncbi:MAG TPA: carbonic anhydrase [Frankiaceae bacterium]|nr:carbonic anhydrase [Frankiaceae bacterium]
MTATDDAVIASRTWRESHFPSEGHLDVAPRKHLAVVACMDSRIDVFGLLGLEVGEAHVLRNAGGVLTDDMIRSLAISQRKLGTREILLVHHTDCGLMRLSEDGFKAELEADTGMRPTWAIESFTDPMVSVRQSMQRIRVSPFIPHRDEVRGFVYDVDTGELREAQ